jgi:predicted Rossmann-fold nucleotide-binding protein
MDYLKPELALRAHGVERTVVGFGSARICEPAEAHHRVDALRAAAAREAENAESARRLAVAERVVDNSRYYDMAREFGRIVGKSNRMNADGQTLIVTGGGPGLMEAANRGVFDVKAKTIGSASAFPTSSFPTPTCRRNSASTSIIS